MAAVTNILLISDGCKTRTAIDSAKTKPYKRKNCPVLYSKCFIQSTLFRSTRFENCSTGGKPHIEPRRAARRGMLNK